MNKFKDLLSEVRMAVSADYKISPSGRKVHKMKKISDVPGDTDGDGDVDANDKKPTTESIVPSHMQGKQKPYVSSDGKGNFEVLGNKGHTKATFSRSEHGSMAQGKAQAHLKAKYDEYMKEEVELDEAVDKQEQRFLMLARLGLVDKSQVSKLRVALDQLKADKPLTVQQRTMLLGVMSDLIALVTGDDTIFNRVKMDVQKEDVQLDEGENKQMKGKDPCWKGYQMVGMKDKNGKKVPNCVPEEKEVEEGYASLAQQRAVWATRKDGGKGHPDNKKKTTKEEVEIEEGRMKDIATNDAEDKRLGSWRKETPWMKAKDTVTDKSGAKHTPMSAAKHLARLALKKQLNKSKE